MANASKTVQHTGKKRINREKRNVVRDEEKKELILRYLLTTINSEKKITVIKIRTMKYVTTVATDSYPIFINSRM